MTRAGEKTFVIERGGGGHLLPQSRAACSRDRQIWLQSAYADLNGVSCNYCLLILVPPQEESDMEEGGFLCSIYIMAMEDPGWENAAWA